MRVFTIFIFFLGLILAHSELLAASPGLDKVEDPLSALCGMPKPFLESTSTSYTPVLCEEFDGDTLNTRLWSYNYTWGDSSQIIGTMRTHNFVATMDEQQVSVQDGRLILRAKNEVHPSAIQTQADGSQTIAQMPWEPGLLHLDV